MPDTRNATLEIAFRKGSAAAESVPAQALAREQVTFQDRHPLRRCLAISGCSARARRDRRHRDRGPRAVGHAAGAGGLADVGKPELRAQAGVTLGAAGGTVLRLLRALGGLGRRLGINVGDDVHVLAELAVGDLPSSARSRMRRAESRRTRIAAAWALLSSGIVIQSCDTAIASRAGLLPRSRRRIRTGKREGLHFTAGDSDHW